MQELTLQSEANHVVQNLFRSMKYLCTPYPNKLLLPGGWKLTAIEHVDQTKEQGFARANKCRAHAHKGPAQLPHALAGTQHLLRQAGWQTRKRGQGTRRQVQSTRTPEGYAVQAPGARHRTCRCRCLL